MVWAILLAGVTNVCDMHEFLFWSTKIISARASFVTISMERIYFVSCFADAHSENHNYEIGRLTY